MTNFNFCLRATSGKARFSQRSSIPFRASLLPFLAIATLSTLGFVGGLVLDFAINPLALTLGSQATAQSATEAELKSYARAILSIEPLRQAAYLEIKKNIGTVDIPAVNCHKKESLDTLPKNTRSIAINYCNRSKKIVEDSGLSISRFNAITVQVQDDPELEKRVQAELIRLQKSTVTP